MKSIHYKYQHIILINHNSYYEIMTNNYNYILDINCNKQYIKTYPNNLVISGYIYMNDENNYSRTLYSRLKYDDDGYLSSNIDSMLSKSILLIYFRRNSYDNLSKFPVKYDIKPINSLMVCQKVS